jgi:hypothetical protein
MGFLFHGLADPQVNGVRENMGMAICGAITTASGAVLTYGIRDASTKQVIASSIFDTDSIAKATWTKITVSLRTGPAPPKGDQSELFFSKNVGGQILIDGVTMAPTFSAPTPNPAKANK